MVGVRSIFFKCRMNLDDKISVDRGCFEVIQIAKDKNCLRADKESP